MAGELVLVIDDSPTITKVVQLVLTKAGYQVQTAVDGEEGLVAVRKKRSGADPPRFRDAADERIPVLSRADVADPKLRDIPVILMSAKGDQVGERFVKVMGIVDYITKPFSPEAITAVVQHTIGKYGGSGADDENPSLITGEDLAATDDADRTHARGGSALAAARPDRRHRQRARRRVVRARGDAAKGSDANAQVATDAASIAQIVRAALDDAALTKMVGSLDLGLFAEGVPGLRGDLRVVPLAEVLQLLDVQEQSGVLIVERTGARVEMYFRRGRVDQAIADGVPDEFLLGRFVTDAELMTRGDFEVFLESRGIGGGGRLDRPAARQARPPRRNRSARAA